MNEKSIRKVLTYDSGNVRATTGWIGIKEAAGEKETSRRLKIIHGSTGISQSKADN